MKKLSLFLVIFSLFSCTNDMESQGISIKGVLIPDTNLEKSLSKDNQIFDKVESAEKLLVNCSCKGDCKFESRCNWVIDYYNQQVMDNESKINKLFLDLEIFGFEVTDGGNYGCFSSFGMQEKKIKRVDVELYKKGKISVLNSKQEWLDTYQNSSANLEERCEWVFE